MPRAISDQVLVVLGASTGIGRATALEAAARGAHVVAAARSTEALGTLVREITDAGGQALAVPTDIAVPADVQRLAHAALERFGRIDTWANVAAVGVYGRFEDITDEEFERVLRVNLLGHVYGARAALPALRAAGGGVLIGVSSVEGVRAVPFHAPYTTSKWALRGFYDTLRIELAEAGEPIAVTTILPASIDTPFFEHARSKLGRLPKPPAPVYAPEVVARAIVDAAEAPRREIPVGGSAVGFFAGQRLSPALTDAVMSLRRVAVGAQTNDEPDDGRDNLDAPMDGPGQVRGSYSGRTFTSSAFTTLLGAAPRPGKLVTGLLSGVRRIPGALGRERERT